MRKMARGTTWDDSPAAAAVLEDAQIRKASARNPRRWEARLMITNFSVDGSARFWNRSMIPWTGLMDAAG
jgi:hypothetical protein